MVFEDILTQERTKNYVWDLSDQMDRYREALCRGGENKGEVLLFEFGIADAQQVKHISRRVLFSDVHIYIYIYN